MKPCMYYYRIWSCRNPMPVLSAVKLSCSQIVQLRCYLCFRTHRSLPLQITGPTHLLKSDNYSSYFPGFKSACQCAGGLASLANVLHQWPWIGPLAAPPHWACQRDVGFTDFSICMSRGPSCLCLIGLAVSRRWGGYNGGEGGDGAEVYHRDVKQKC